MQGSLSARVMRVSRSVSSVWAAFHEPATAVAYDRLVCQDAVPETLLLDVHNRALTLPGPARSSNVPDQFSHDDRVAIATPASALVVGVAAGAVGTASGGFGSAAGEIGATGGGGGDGFGIAAGAVTAFAGRLPAMRACTAAPPTPARITASATAPPIAYGIIPRDGADAGTAIIGGGATIGASDCECAIAGGAIAFVIAGGAIIGVLGRPA